MQVRVLTMLGSLTTNDKSVVVEEALTDYLKDEVARTANLLPGFTWDLHGDITIHAQMRTADGSPFPVRLVCRWLGLAGVFKEGKDNG